MKARFLAQPSAVGDETLEDFLGEIAAAPWVQRLDIATAWARRSGFVRVQPALERLRARAVHVAMVLGIDAGGATEQGLPCAFELIEDVWVFHDESAQRRTFHPKIYLASGEDVAWLLVGSHNLTAGGLTMNYEAGLCLNLDLTVAPDRELHDDIVAYFDRLRSSEAGCKPLTLDFLERLLAERKRYRIHDQDERRPSGSADGHEDSPPLFGPAFPPPPQLPAPVPSEPAPNDSLGPDDTATHGVPWRETCPNCGRKASVQSNVAGNLVLETHKAPKAGGGAVGAGLRCDGVPGHAFFVSGSRRSQRRG